LTDLSQTSLKEPVKLDWDTAFSGSKFSAPPPALGPDGKPITYNAKVTAITQTDADEGYLNFMIDFDINGARSRSWVSTKPFTKMVNGERVPMKGNPNRLASYLRSCGLPAKPQSNTEYAAAVKMTLNKTIPVTIDWEARDKQTGEQIKGFLSFPDDLERPGQKKAILKKGDLYTNRDKDGNILSEATVQAEVLFANARIKYFQDPTPRVSR
jgi:hypothetical protein